MMGSGEITGLLAPIYTVLILGAGYISLWFKYKFINSRYDNDMSNFYTLSSFDKAIQTLLCGIFSISITSLAFGITINDLSNLSVFIESDKFISFLVLQYFIAFYLGFVWGLVELRLNDKKIEWKKPIM